MLYNSRAFWQGFALGFALPWIWLDCWLRALQPEPPKPQLRLVPVLPVPHRHSS